MRRGALAILAFSVVVTTIAHPLATPPVLGQMGNLRETSLQSLARCRAAYSELAVRLAVLEDRETLQEVKQPAELDIVEEPESQEVLSERKATARGFYFNLVMAFSCVALAALAAGLTMGLVSIDPMMMEIIMQTEDKDIADEQDKMDLKDDQRFANVILPLIQDHHRLLVTLLLINSLANEALPIFLDQIAPSWMAVLMSVTLVLIFGEIVPSAIFTGKKQLQIAATFAPFVTLFRFVLSPIALPIAKVLDRCLGEEHKGRYNFAELRAIVGLHAKLHTGGAPMAVFKSLPSPSSGIICTKEPHHFTAESVIVFTHTKAVPAVSSKLTEDVPYHVKPCPPSTGRDKKYNFQLYKSKERHPKDLIIFQPGEIVSGVFKLQERDEIKIMHGVMLLTHMTAEQAMIPLRQAYMLEGNTRLTLETLQEIERTGHSRVPVYSGLKHNVRGFLLVKKCICISSADDAGKGRTVESLGLQELVVVHPHIKMLDLLNKFQEERCHLALITNEPDLVKQSWSTGIEIAPDVHMAGIITLEDVIEKLLQEDIDDEYDERVRISQSLLLPPEIKIRRATPSPSSRAPSVISTSRHSTPRRPSTPKGTGELLETAKDVASKQTLQTPLLAAR